MAKNTLEEKFTKPIPVRQVPNIKDYQTLSSNEDITSLSKAGFYVESQYYKQNIKGSYKDCYARKNVVKMLKKAQKLLPNKISIKIYDAYRSIIVQQTLWDNYKQKIVKENPNLNINEIDDKVSLFVSKPSYDITKPSLHNTGGAVDLTLVDENGNELNMGTLFDDFTPKSWTSYYETHDLNDEIKENRRLLYNVMIKAGFTNLPSEWWHYEYGTKFWGYINKKSAIYKGKLNIKFKDQI